MTQSESSDMANGDTLPSRFIAWARRLSRSLARHIGRPPGTATSALGLAADEPGLTSDERRWRREARSGWLRLAVLIILIMNLWAGEHEGNLLVHANVVAGYTLASLLALGLALTRNGPLWSGTAFVVVDAVAVVALFHEHLLGSSPSLDHALTAPSLAIAFLLLNHVGLRLKPRLVLLFAALVLIGWLSLLLITTFLHRSELADPHLSSGVAAEVALAAAFAFAALVVVLLTQDHNVLLKSAIKSERRRQNLSRFFSPSIISELQATGSSLDLERREAAVMFVDLRSFTRFSETAHPRDLAKLLAEYRQLVADTVFRWGGTVDKFIGDGVMAVFGQPRPAPNDVDHALGCGLEVNQALALWTKRRREAGQEGLDAGIGLHFGLVVGGVLESGCHDEFTVFGDAVNVADRLERLAKRLGASLVVSADLLEKAQSPFNATPWIWQNEVELDGRVGTLRIAYLPRSLKDSPVCSSTL